MNLTLKFSWLVLMTFILVSCARQHHLELVGHKKPGSSVGMSPSASDRGSDMELKHIATQEAPALVADASIAEQQLAPLISLRRQNNRQLLVQQSAKVERREDGSVQHQELTVLNKYEAQRIIKSAIKQSSQSGTVSKVLLIILCFLLPPLAVGLAKGIGWPFWLSLILTLCFWIPGVIYALIVILGD